MTLITTASFFGTGSSAVKDFLAEFDIIDTSLGEWEYRFLHDANGIGDLEYNIVENNNRHNTSNAIKRYIKFAKLLSSPWYFSMYKRAFGKDFMKYTMEYIDQITEVKTKSWWHGDAVERGAFFCFIDRMYSRLCHVLTLQFKRGKKAYSLCRNETGYYTAIDEEKFLEATRTYTDKLLQSANKNNSDYMVIEQMVPPSNTQRYVRYLSDVKVIIVDRDPRDVYLKEKELSKWKVIPTNTVEEYVAWYKATRTRLYKEKDDPNRILRIRFEDLIYKYEETTDAIINFLGLDKSCHARPKTQFIPDVSIKGTNMAKQYPQYEQDMKIIEQELSDYLYDFS